MALPAGRYGVTKNQLLKIKKLPMNTMGMIKDTKEGIAIIEDAAKASQLITAGRQFWHNGKLYSADVDIAKDSNIITSGEGKNATEMPNITDQLPGTDAEKANEVSIARVENGSNPAATINSGDQFYHLGILYTATSDITTEDTITPGTNCSVSDSVTEQIKTVKDSLGTASAKNSTSVVTDSTDLVESGAVKDIVGWGNKNLCTYPIGTRQVISPQGVITDNDGIYLSDYVKVPSDKLYFSFASKQGDVYFRVAFYNSLKEFISRPNVTTSGSVIDVPPNAVYFRMCFEDNKTGQVSDYLIDPFVCDNNLSDKTYEPYHASVEESKADNSVIGTVENGTNPTKSYAVGEHFIRNGKFCTCTVAVTTSSTWTLGSNYVEGQLGDVLYKVYSKSVTVSAESYTSVDIPVIDGYQIVSANATASGTGASADFNVDFNHGSGNYVAAAKVRNSGSENRTWLVYFMVIYVKANTITVEALT